MLTAMIESQTNMPGTVLWLRWGHDCFADDETCLGQLCCDNVAMTALAIVDDGTCLGKLM